MSLEEYLMSIGFNKMVYDHKTKALKDAGKYDILSTMGHIYFAYVKGDISIYWGLNESGKPPTLMSPRESVFERKEKEIIIDGKKHTQHYVTDDQVNAWMWGKSGKEIYESITSNNKILI